MRSVPRAVLADRSRFRRALVDRVLSDSGVEVVGHATDPVELLDVCRATHPKVVIMDVAAEDGGLDGGFSAALTELGREGISVLVVSESAAPEHLTFVLEAGASGFLLYDTAPNQLAEAVYVLAEGGAVLDPAAARTVLRQWRRLRATGWTGGARPALTPRETDVLAGMVDGLATKAIARRLGVALKTVENHKIHIFDKLGVRTQAEAVALAIGHGLLVDATASALVGQR